MTPNTKRVVAKVISGAVVGVGAGWMVRRVLKGVPGAGLAAFVLVTLAHQKFDSPVSDFVYKQL